ncbi:unnamed protein product [Symbiodinium microadriaticum]|nr:unnamed protein product [Symbiodinium microadriaticum]
MRTCSRGLQTVLDLKKQLEQVVVDLPIPQQRLTLLRTEKRPRGQVTALLQRGSPGRLLPPCRLEPESQQLAALGLKDGDELAPRPRNCSSKVQWPSESLVPGVAGAFMDGSTRALTSCAGQAVSQRCPLPQSDFLASPIAKEHMRLDPGMTASMPNESD